MSKTLQNIIEKAHKTGFANKNARMWLDYGYGELESQWSVLSLLYLTFMDKVKVTVMH